MTIKMMINMKSPVEGGAGMANVLEAPTLEILRWRR